MKKISFFLFILTFGFCGYAKDFQTKLISDSEGTFSGSTIELNYQTNTLNIKEMNELEVEFDWTITEITESEASELFIDLFNNFQEKPEYLIDDNQFMMYVFFLELFEIVLDPLLDDNNQLIISYKDLIEYANNAKNPFDFD